MLHKSVLFAFVSLSLATGSALACAKKVPSPTCHCEKPAAKKARVQEPQYRYYWQMPEDLARSTCERQGGEWDPSVGICQTY